MRHIIPISGKDSLATAIWQTAKEPDLPYEYVFTDTRAELPPTYAWLDKVERTLDIKIERIGKSLENVIDEQGILPSPRMRFCTKYAKIFPMNKYLGKDSAMCYFGIRADEPDRIGALEMKRFTPVYPLKDSGIGLATVYRIVQGKDLMPPAFFWKRLYDAAALAAADSMFILETWPQWMKDRLFAWRSRPNCYFCFFQRRYEWVGLLEHYPALFANAEAIEERNSGDRRENAFTWVQDMPLSRIRDNAEAIFQSRVDAVVKLIVASRQADLFRDGLDDMDLAATSCGLLCGK